MDQHLQWDDLYEQLWVRLQEEEPKVRLNGHAWPDGDADGFRGELVSSSDDGTWLRVGLRPDVLGKDPGNRRVPVVEFYTNAPADPFWLNLVGRVQVDGGPVADVVILREVGKAARIVAVRAPPLEPEEALAALSEIVDWLRQTCGSFRAYAPRRWFHLSSDAASVAKAAAHAARRYGVTDGLVQDYLKPTTMLLIDELLGPDLPSGRDMLWIAVNAMRKDNDRRWVVDTLHRDRLWVEHYEVLVDFHLFSGRVFPYRTLLTAESEGYQPSVARLCQMPLPTKDEDWKDNDLMWDAWKLLIVPSPLRLFTSIAREDQWGKLKAHFAHFLGRQTTVGGFQGSPFVLVAFDPPSTPAAQVRVAYWRSGAWLAQPTLIARPLSPPTLGGTDDA